MLPLDARLLAILREAPVHLPSSDLAAQLGAPLAAVTDRVAGLRAAGFEIEDRPGYGLRLLASPDRLVADDLRARLGEASALVDEVLVFTETASTNDLALDLGPTSAGAGRAIFAERQTAGRGRFGRRWESAAARGLWFSLALRPAEALEHWPRLTTWAAVAVAVAVERALGGAARVEIKWPNDVLAGGRKVAGILTEVAHDVAGRSFAVLGIGVNVNHATEDFPPELATRAGSLAMAAGRPLDRPALAAGILQALAERDLARRDHFPELVAEARARSALIGRWVEIRTGDTLLAGQAEDLDPEGRLLLRTGDGRLHTLHAGEATTQPAPGA